MKKRVLAACMALLSCGCALAAGAAEQAKTFYIHDGDRVVFYGDSITCGEWYPTLVETFVLTRFPKWRNEFFNRGVSGDNSGNLKRFERDVVTTKPDVLFYMMGYNDGGSADLTAAAIEKFSANVTESVKMARTARPGMRIMLVSPTANETQVSSSYPRWVTSDAYPYTLLMLGREEQRIARRLGADFADMTTLYGQTMGLGQVMAGKTFSLSRDGVHPQQEGQTFIAFNLLKSMGASSILAETVIDAAKAKAEKSASCSVEDLKAEGGIISFSRTCESLPYPTPEVARPFSFIVDIDGAINSDILCVKGLAAPAYSIKIDGAKIAEVAASRLEDGVNLSEYSSTPMYQQAAKVLELVRKKDIMECDFWWTWIVTKKADGNGKPAEDLDKESLAKLEADRAEIKEAREKCYEACRPQKHLIALEPLESKMSFFSQETENEWNRSFLVFTLKGPSFDWNAMKLIDNKFDVIVKNSGSSAQTGAVSWTCPSGWKITPPEAVFTVDPAQTKNIPFEISFDGKSPTPVPTALARWNWTSKWPYPRTRAIEMELLPRLTIPMAKKPVTLDGKLDDWDDAAEVRLDDLYYVDPGVPGKRLLWNGPEDLSMRLLFKWDEKALYLAAIVKDDVHIQEMASPGMMWFQDMIHVGAFMSEKGKPDGRYEYGFGVYPDKDAIVPFMSPVKEDAPVPKIQFKSGQDQAAHECIYEIAIPWERLAPFQPAQEKSFKFTALAGEADPTPGKGYNYIGWTNGLSYGKSVADFATIVLGPQKK